MKRTLSSSNWPAYACLPLKNTREPVELLSYILLDKDLILEDDIDDLGKYLLSQLG